MMFCSIKHLFIRQIGLVSVVIPCVLCVADLC